MNHSLETKIRDLVADNQLDDALDLLINDEVHNNQRKQHVLLVLKGKLSLLEEQQLAGILSAEELGRQRAAIAHQLLDIADGSSLDQELPREAPEDSVPRAVPAARPARWPKLLLAVALLGAAVYLGVFIARPSGGSEPKRPGPQAPQDVPQDVPQDADQDVPQDADQDAPEGEVQLTSFPNYRKKFNFLDFQLEFLDVTAVRASDQQVRLRLRYKLVCHSNLGICYRESVRVFVDDDPIAPHERKKLFGYIEHNATEEEELVFLLDAQARDYAIELSRDGSSWRRSFKIPLH